MSSQERFRIHRNASCFSDRYSVDVFVLSDGTVNGTIRDTANGTAFVPVRLQIEESEFRGLQEAFRRATSSESESWINIGYGEFGRPLEIKHLSPPLEGKTPLENSVLWEKANAVCNRCLQCRPPE